MSYATNPLVSRLLFHSYGQGGTVAVPAATSGAQQSAPMGEFPPGIGEMLDYLVTRHGNWATGSPEIDWCFLVGGPGNGKSEALRLLASRLGVALPQRAPGQRVARTIPENWPSVRNDLPTGLSVAFVNDASIPRPSATGVSSAPGSLLLDIVDAVEEIGRGIPTALFVNVNRGILVEELGGLRQLNAASMTPAQRAATGIIRWLSSPPQNSVSIEGIETAVVPGATTPHYGQFALALVPVANVKIVVHVVFLDVLSLLEPRPGTGARAIDFTMSPPTVAHYQTLGQLVSREVTRDQTIAGGLLRTYVASGFWEAGGCLDQATGERCQAFALCPFAQNSAWLQQDSLRQRFLDTLRAAEIAAGRRLTYRDLLGHISQAMIGPPRQAWLTGGSPCSWVGERHQRAMNGSKEATVELASVRLFLNLFPGAGFSVERKVAEHKRSGESVFGSLLPILLPTGEPARPESYERAFSDIDPALDTEGWNGLRKRVLDAVESLDVEEPCTQAATWSQLSATVISDLDRMLDRVLREEIADELPQGSRAATIRVRVLRRWRAAALLRQVGLAVGHMRFAPALESWLAEQESALNGGPRLRLGDGINNLILPTGGTGRVHLAPLRPRTYCLAGDLPKNTILVSVNVNELDVIIVPHGDTLVAEVQVRRRQSAPQTLAVLTIDLTVAREALLHSAQKSDSFTEIGDTAFARIERARASLISRERLRTLPAQYTDDRAVLHQISPNPIAQPPLRVQQL